MDVDDITWIGGSFQLRNRLQKWEIALLCAVIVALGWSLVLGRTPCAAWWGTIYPELTPADGSAQTLAAAGADGVALRLRLLEWLSACLAALGLK